MEVTYQLTEADYRHGLRTWQTRTPWRLWNYRLSIVVLIVLFVFGLIVLLWNPSLELRYFSLFALGMPVVGLITMWILPRIHARIQYRRMPTAQSPIALAVSDSGLDMKSTHFDSHLNWSTYIGWAEGVSVFVLFPQPKIYIPIPKRAFSEEQVGEFREMLRRNIKAS